MANGRARRALKRAAPKPDAELLLRPVRLGQEDNKMQASRFWFPALGAAFAVAGADKLIGNRGYSRMFRHLGWGSGAKRAVAVAEMAGGALLAAPSTRRLGGAVLAATSAAVLTSEVRHGDGGLALPRALLLVAALTGVARR